MKLLQKKYVLIISSMALIVSSCAGSVQTAPPPETAALSPTAIATQIATPQAADASQLAPDLAYPLLLEQVKRSDPKLDFTKLRWTFAQTASYDPYTLDNDKLKGSMYDAYENSEYNLAIELANQMLEKNYLLPDPHFILLRSYQELGDQQNADFHDYFLKGLITSILETGNGKSPETAFIVIHFEEELFMLSILGLQNSKPTFREENGIPYDIFEGIEEGTNQQTTLYFDINIPYHWLNNSIPH
jgi:hypothetical protein